MKILPRDINISLKKVRSHKKTSRGNFWFSKSLIMAKNYQFRGFVVKYKKIMPYLTFKLHLSGLGVFAVQN